jgi:hypothetical protein
MKHGLAQEWNSRSEGIMKDIETWRERHPKATFREIEQEIDQRLSELRAKILSDTANSSVLADWEKGGLGVVCQQCGVALEKKGKKKRKLDTRGGREVALEREYGVCPKCGQGIFPPG